MKLIMMIFLCTGLNTFAQAPSGSQDKSQMQKQEHNRQEEQDRLEKLKFHTRDDDPKVKGKFYDDNHPEKQKYLPDEDGSKEGEI